ncbi:hypothetical protein HED60_03495 [Planctomycetales bacterium ZRK34]|nr:hypothetical protein HED60_03495 [Planctomycetales bacterium ZRK34]
MFSRMTFTTLLVAIASMMITANAHAVFVSPDDFATGWSRGDTDTLYAEWDLFESSTNALPDVGSFHPPAGDPTLSSDTGGVTGTANIYGFNAHTITIDTANYNTASSNTTVVVQIRTQGTEYDPSTLMINGAAPTYLGELSRTPVASFGGDTFEVDTWALFNLSGADDLTVSFTASGQHMSLLAVALDAIVTDSSGFASVTPQGAPVPQPASLVMLLGGLALMRRRK